MLEFPMYQYFGNLNIPEFKKFHHIHNLEIWPQPWVRNMAMVTNVGISIYQHFRNSNVSVC